MATPTQRWVQNFRASVHTVAERGWSVKESRGSVRLSVRHGAKGEGVSVTLPIAWASDTAGEAVELIRRLYERVSAGGCDLRQALEEITPKENATAAAIGVDWPDLLRAFLADKRQHGTQIKPSTQEAYERYLGRAVLLLTEPNPPRTAYELGSRTLEAWPRKTRARQQCVGAIAQMLAFGRLHHGLGLEWAFPEGAKERLVGKPAVSRVKATLTDPQILALIDAAGTQEWKNALMLMATYGLRPEELRRHLVVRIDEHTGEPYLWCSYRKRSGRYLTKERRLYPLPLQGVDGELVQWELPRLMQAGLLPLPVLGDGGNAVGTYLRRQPLWKEYVRQAAERVEWLRPYTFRDSYSLRGHLRRVEQGALAAAMGHSLACHSQHYVWATAGTVRDEFERVAASMS